MQNLNQGSASVTGSPGSRGSGSGNLGQGLGPGLIRKFRTWTGTQIQNLRDSGPGLKSEKSGTRDWDRNSSKYLGLCIFLHGTKIFTNTSLRDPPVNQGLGQGPGLLEIRDPGRGLEILKSGIRDWERNPDLWEAEFRDSTIRDYPGD